MIIQPSPQHKRKYPKLKVATLLSLLKALLQLDSNFAACKVLHSNVQAWSPAKKSQNKQFPMLIYSRLDEQNKICAPQQVSVQVTTILRTEKVAAQVGRTLVLRE